MTPRRAPYLVQPFASCVARGARRASIGALLALLLGGCGSTVPDSKPMGFAGAGGAQTGGAGTGSGGAVGESSAGVPGGAGSSNGTSGGSGAAAGGSSGAASNGGLGGAGAAAPSGGNAGIGGSSAAGAGGGQTGGPPPCAAAKHLICEDFEATASGSIPTGWSKQGDIEVTTDDAYRSAHSLKVFVTANVAENYRSISMNPSALGTGHWGRVYYRVQAPVPAYFAHDTFVALTGDGPDPEFKNENVRVVDTVHNADATHSFLYNVQPVNVTEFGKGSPYLYTFNDGGWHCAEWHIDNPTQSFHFYYDGSEITSMAIDNGPGNNQGSEIPAAFSKLTLGVAQYQSPPDNFTEQPMWFTAWFDDLALDATRIGCN